MHCPATAASHRLTVVVRDVAGGATKAVPGCSSAVGMLALAFSTYGLGIRGTV